MSPASQPDPHQGKWFATTLWSVVTAAGQQESAAARPALEQLCTTYWPALYAYVRSRGYAPEDARDLTQALFSHLLEKNAFAMADPNKGKFRSFLLASANHFLADEWDRVNAQKRGGGRVILSLDDRTMENLAHWEPAANEPSEMVFDRRWAFTLLQRGISQLEAEFQRDGKTVQFEALKCFLTDKADSLGYKEVAGTLGTTPQTIAVLVHRMRQRYRDLVRAEVAQTVASPADVDPEMQYLLSVLGA